MAKGGTPKSAPAKPAAKGAASGKAPPSPAKKAAPAATPAAKKAAPAPAPAAKRAAAPAAPTKKAAPVAPAAKKAAAAPAPAKRAAEPAAPAKKAAVAPAPAPAPVAAPAPAPAAPAAAAKKAAPPVKPPFRSGPAEPLGGPLDAKFLDAQREMLEEERVKLLGQAESLEGEAAALMEDLDPGDVQFDDESGEGDTMVVERSRDLALSAQARQLVVEIDAALIRIEARTYGYSLVSGKPIPKDRLRAIPWAIELVEEKVGGLGRR